MKLFLMARTSRGGGGVKAWTLGKKTFFEARKKNSGIFFVSTKLEEGGG